MAHASSGAKPKEVIVESAIPVELLEQCERENVLLFMGEGVNHGSLPSSAELARDLAQRCEYPPDEPLTLPRVAGYYELVRDRNGLITFLRDRLDVQGLDPPRAHQLIAHLRPQTIITTCYDRLLEQALRQANVPYTPAVGNEDVAFAEEHKILLVWMWGVLDQPDSLLITEDDHRIFLESRGNLSDVLCSELARRTWLFLGFDLEDVWFRGFYDGAQRGLDRLGRRAYVFGATPGAYTRLWWEKRNVSILETEVTQLLQTLVEQLAGRSQPAERIDRPVAKIPAAPLPDAPYKRLDYYRENDRSLFFGRDQEIERLAALIHAHRLVLFYGASGTGKTSLLQAGVIPRLKYSEPGYAVIVVRVLDDVRMAIRGAVARQLDTLASRPDEALLETLAGVTETLGPTVLVLDQFEEFFVHVDLETRQQLIGELAALYQAQDVPVKIVFSLREDSLARMGELEQRIVEIFRIRFQLQPLTTEQARQTIVRPVEAMGRRYEPALVDRLLDDLTDEGVMPPQLQLVCSTLYDRLAPDESQISLPRYEELGGAAGILNEYLVGELARLAGPERALARSIFKELVDVNGHKRVCTKEDLSRALGAGPAQLEPMLETLVHSHLIRPLDLEQQGETGYELAHEYLAGEIVQWFDPLESERKQAYELLRQDADRWRQFGTPVPGPTLDLLVPHWEDLILQPEERALILCSAIQQGWQVEEWIERLGTGVDSIEVAMELLRAPEETARLHTARCWRSLPANASADEALAQVAVDDPARSVRAAAAISLAHRAPARGAELLAGRQAGASRPRQVEALARIWDETAPLRSLPMTWQMPVILAVARIRLKRSGQTLLYHSLAGVIGGIVTGLLAFVIIIAYLWLATPTQLEATAAWLLAGLSILLIVSLFHTCVFGTVMVLSSSLSLALLKRPRRWIIVVSSGVVSGLIQGLVYHMFLPLFRDDLSTSMPLADFMCGFVMGGLTGAGVAWLLWHRHIKNAMPSPLVGFVLGVIIGIGNGLATATVFLAQPPNEAIGWVLDVAVWTTAILWGINLAIRIADRLLASSAMAEAQYTTGS